ncbi:MAG: patatin-like phospholipase family protein [Acidimicrobiales bacterium]
MVIREDNLSAPGSDGAGEPAPASKAPPSRPRLGPQPVNLVLEGGGVKGIGLVGAISVLEERGFSFVRIAGTSAGAIVGSLVAAGFSSAELRDLMSALDYTKFRDASRWERALPITEGSDLWFHEGIYKGEYFHQWIGEQLATKGTRTFRDLRLDLGAGVLEAEQYRLVVMASDISQGALVRLPWDFVDPAHPRDDQPVADAIRASMSIPFFYRPFTLNVVTDRPSILVDGGMLSNFPVDAFDGPDGAPPGQPTIGIKLSARQRADVIRHQVKGDISLAMAMLGTMQSWSDQMHLDDPLVIDRTIFVDTLGVNATDFEITRDVQDRLFDNGRSAAEQWLIG